MLEKTVAVAWDSEAEAEATRQAQEASSRDPEAASLLVSQVLVSREIRKEQGYDEPFASEYDPARLYTQVAREFKYTPTQIDEIHYLTFFAMVRNLVELQEEEERQHKEQMRKYNK